MEEKLIKLILENEGDIDLVIEELQKELKDLDGRRLNNVDCERCSGHFGYSAEEGYLYDCSDCQAYNKYKKERKEKLNSWITKLEAMN